MPDGLAVVGEVFRAEGADAEGWVVRTWLELTDNPDSYMLLMDNGPDGLPDPTTEARAPLLCARQDGDPIQQCPAKFEP